MTAPAIAAAMQVEFMASALGACRAGHGWMARCPAHSDRTPSLSIDIGENGKLLVFCHAGCTQTAVIAALRERGLWSGIAEVRPVPRKRKDGPAVPDKAHLTAIALRVWDTAKDATGSLAETYLRTRGLELPASDALRFHAGLRHPSGAYLPAMIALVMRGTDDQPLGIHRTFLSADGRGKAPSSRSA